MVRKLIFNGSVSKLERPTGERPSDARKISDANVSNCSNIGNNIIETSALNATGSKDQGKDKVAG